MPSPASSTCASAIAPSSPRLREADLARLARRCQAQLRLHYATPSDNQDAMKLVRDTDLCYKRLHWLWHHEMQTRTTASTPHPHEPIDHAHEQPLETLRVVVEASIATASASSISHDCGHAVEVCAEFCCQFGFEQRRLATYRAEQARRARRQHQTDEEQTPQAHNESHIDAPKPVEPCHQDGSCHLSVPSITAAAAASGELDSADTFLLAMHSVFLMRIVFLFLFNQASLVDTPVIPAAATSSPPSSPPSSTADLPLLSRLCQSFTRWPSALHQAVHSFDDNLQWCCYVHMIVGLRTTGGGGGDVAPSPYAVDGRVWKRILSSMKAKQTQGIIRADELKRQYQVMMSSSPATYLLPPSSLPSSDRTAAAAAAASRVPSAIYVLGDSHTVTLHSQWLILVHAHQQRISWLQMRSSLVVGLKAWHVGQVVPEGSGDTPFPPLHQSSMLRRYAALIPPGSRVLLVAGEIDCRADEGITAAVSKGKYASAAAGVHDTVRSFLAGAQRLATAHRWQAVMIHPICTPYLRGHKVRIAKKGWKDMKEERRRDQERTTNDDPESAADAATELPSLLARVHARAQLIMEFNLELKRQLAALASSSATSVGVCRLQYLDFYSSLATPESRDTNAPLLQADYTLDGMHLNTRYIPLIEREMEVALDDDEAA